MQSRPSGAHLNLVSGQLKLVNGHSSPATALSKPATALSHPATALSHPAPVHLHRATGHSPADAAHPHAHTASSDRRCASGPFDLLRARSAEPHVARVLQHGSTRTVHWRVFTQRKQMQFLAARRIGQQCHADKALRPGEMNTAQVRTALDMLVKRLTQLAMEQDTSRMRSAGEGRRERRLALEFHGRHLRPMVAVVKLCLPNEIQLSSIRLHPQFLARLRAAADDLVASTAGRATQRSMRTVATNSLRAWPLLRRRRGVDSRDRESRLRPRSKAPLL